jgi:Spy/CpxP family protein refolding chaperone
MKRRSSIVVAIAAVLVLTFVASAHAEWGRGMGKGKMDKKMMRERVELVKMWKLTEVLDLDQESAAKLFPIIHEFDVRQRELKKQRGETIKQMKEALKADAPDAAAISSLLAEFKGNERAMVDLRIERLDAYSKIVGDERVAKLVTVLPGFEKKMRGMLGKGGGRHDKKGRHGGKGMRKMDCGQPPCDQPCGGPGAGSGSK